MPAPIKPNRLTSPFDESIDTTSPARVIGYDEDSIAPVNKMHVEVTLDLNRPLTSLEASRFKRQSVHYVEGAAKVVAQRVGLAHLQMAIDGINAALETAHSGALTKIREDTWVVEQAKRVFREHKFE